MKPQDCEVLIVDDNPLNRAAFEAVLNEEGYQTVLADSGLEALKKAMDHEFAAILLDVRMPQMDGYETAALLRQRERTRHTPIIFTSAYDRTPMHISMGYRAGATDYLLSPVEDEVLRVKVAAYVKLYLERTELKSEVRRLEAMVHTLSAELTQVRPAERALQARVRELEEHLRKLHEHLVQAI